MISPGSTHPDGYVYKTIGTKEPIVFDEKKSDWLERILAEMYEKVKDTGNKSIFEKRNSKLHPDLKGIAKSLNLDESKELTSIEEGTRNPTLFNFTLCMLGYHYKRKNGQELEDFLFEINTKLCKPPLSEEEVATIWSSASNYAKVNHKKKTFDSEDKNNEIKTNLKNKITCFKFTCDGKINESVILNESPFFIRLDNDGSIKVTEQIEQGLGVYGPARAEDHPYKPLKFDRSDELQKFVDIINTKQKITIDWLFRKIKEYISKFIVHDEYILDYIAALILFSYFQDKFATVPYTMFVSDGGSGKSTIGDVFEMLGYRVVNMTDPTTANIFRIFGTIEPGQCTLVLDEAEKIDQYQEMRSILKNGYQNGKRVQRINMNSNQQEHFHTYGLKIMLSERSPNPSKAKGILDRMFVISTYKGKPLFDIKEVKNPTNVKNSELNKELDFLRKTLMTYRLKHFCDDVSDIETGLEGRDKELCKPVLQLFYGSESEKRVRRALEKLIDEKNQRKSNSLEGILLEVVSYLLNQYSDGVIPFSLIWSALKDKTNGVENEYKENQMETEMYGTIYKMSISKILRDRFGARDPLTRRSSSVRSLVFDIEKTKKYFDSYRMENCPTKITCTTIQDKDNTDQSDSTDSINERLFKKLFE